MMASPNKPPGDDPLSRLLNEAGKQIESRLKDWAAKNTGGNTSGSGNAAGKTTLRTGMSNTQSAVSTNSGTRAADPAKTATPLATAMPGSKYDGSGQPLQGVHHELHEAGRNKWIIRLIVFVVSAFAIGKYLGSGKSTHSTDISGFNGINSFLGEITMSGLFSSIVPLAIFIVGIIFVIKAIRVVPQQRALVIERLGRFDRVLEPGLRFTIPFVDRVSARHDLRETPLDVPPQVCITKDNTDRKSTRLNSSHERLSRMPSSA